ncbi:hypothetical protein NX059_007787 [Plenodomus lindquistii]|nr:hypothetical protein NX059_007787 [Plenodomus lindquistii]
MTSDDNADSDVEKDDEFWDRWLLNTYERKLVKPMKKPLTAPLDLAISDSDVEKLKAGFRPRNLDDKYAWLIEDENSNISIHVIRYFVGEEIYILHIAPRASNDSGASAKIHSITWEGDVNGIQTNLEQALEHIVILARDDVKCDFDALLH